MQNKVRSWKLEVRRTSSSSKSCFFILSSSFYYLNSTAQCAMCRASLESEGNSVKAEAVNDGIVYLMGIPYLLVAVVGFIVYKMYNKKKRETS